MHEYSIVSALLDRVATEARAREAIAVHRVQVQVGELSGVDPELLASAYEIFRERGVCAAAELDIVPVKARWVCSGCGGEIAPGAALRCPDCRVAARLAGGDEILLRRIEMEVA